MNIPIVTITDNKLAFAIATLFINLLETQKTENFLELNVLVTPDFTLDNLDKIQQVQSLYQNSCKINIIKMDDRFDHIKNQTGYIANACAYKMCLAEMFPNYDKVIYLDSDIIVLNDLENLYKTDLGNNYIGGVFSLAHFFNQEKYLKRLNIPNMLYYVNAGVLLFNLKQIRSDNIEPQLQSLIGSFYDSVDQHIYNKVCYSKILMLPPKYNTTRTNEPLYQKSIAKIAFTETDINETKNPVIYHYTGPNKPWNTLNLKYSIIWLRYYNKTAYKDIELFSMEKELIKLLNKKYSILKQIFSITNVFKKNQKYKSITLLGLRFYIKRKG